jgi:hypothetical protein
MPAPQTEGIHFEGGRIGCVRPFGVKRPLQSERLGRVPNVVFPRRAATVWHCGDVVRAGPGDLVCGVNVRSCDKRQTSRVHTVHREVARRSSLAQAFWSCAIRREVAHNTALCQVLFLTQSRQGAKNWLFLAALRETQKKSAALESTESPTISGLTQRRRGRKNAASLRLCVRMKIPLISVFAATLRGIAQLQDSRVGLPKNTGSRRGAVPVGRQTNAHVPRQIRHRPIALIRGDI